MRLLELINSLIIQPESSIPELFGFSGPHCLLHDAHIK
jgi:hypothetical protein